MILIFDIGNSNITAGLFIGDKLLFDFRLRSDTGDTERGYFIKSQVLLKKNGVNLADIHGCLVGSVVPALTGVMVKMVKKYFNISPVTMNSETKLNIKNMYKNKKEVGEDRLANAAEARREFGKKDMVIIDFGTAITFDVVNKKGQYLGGTIIPGINMSLQALSDRTAKLPRLDMKFPVKTIGNTTEQAIRSGIAGLIAGGVNYTLEKMKKELKAKDITVILTGGEVTEKIAMKIREKNVVMDKHFTLKGFRYIYDMNS